MVVRFDLGYSKLINEQACISTLAVRHMVHPFSTGRNILLQAAPMEDILRELSTQLAELRAFKQQEGPVQAPA